MTLDLTLTEPPPINDYPQPVEPMPYALDATAFALRVVSPDVMDRRRRIHALQLSMASGLPGVHGGPEPLNLFTPGVYFRQVVLPAGDVIVSKRHAKEHICTVSKGSATVFTEDGVTLIVGPHSFVSPAGAKRVLLVHEEITWATAHRTDATDLAEVERELIMDETTLLIGVVK